MKVLLQSLTFRHGLYWVCVSNLFIYKPVLVKIERILLYRILIIVVFRNGAVAAIDINGYSCTISIKKIKSITH